MRYTRREAIVKRPPYMQVALSATVIAAIAWRVPIAGLRSAFRNLEYGSCFVGLSPSGPAPLACL